MSIPQWLSAILQTFGQNIGLETFALNERGAAVLHFDTDVDFRMEYASGALALVLSVPMRESTEAFKRLLNYAQPELQPEFTLRAGYHAPTSRAFFMTRLNEREVSLPALNAVFTGLWEIAEDFRARIA